MNPKSLLSFGLLTLSLYACSSTPSSQSGTGVAPVTVPAWTTTEIEAKGIIDLSELGAMSYDASNQAYISGRLVPDAVLGSYSYTSGDSYVNVLNIDAATFAQLPDGLAAALIHASPSDIHRYADRYGIDTKAIRIASLNDDMNSKEFYSILGTAKNPQLLKSDVLINFQDVKASAFTNMLERVTGSMK